MKPSTMNSEERRDAIVAAAEDKKANYITEIDLRGRTIISDFFIICSGTSNIHIRSIADGIIEGMEKLGIRQNRMEGYSEATWIILDYGDNIVHVMAENERGYYGLERLWGARRPETTGDDDASSDDATPVPEAEDASA